MTDRSGFKSQLHKLRREKAPLEENGGGPRRGGSKPFNNRPLEDQEPSSEGSWRGKGQVKQASPAETQVSSTSWLETGIMPSKLLSPGHGSRTKARHDTELSKICLSSPRGRGRGVRGGRSMTTAEFVPTSSRTLPVKSVSETRTTPPQIEGDMDNYPVKSQVIIPTQDNLSRDIGRMSLSEPAQTNNREYQNQRRTNMNLLADAVFRHRLVLQGVAAPRSIGRGLVPQVVPYTPLPHPTQCLASTMSSSVKFSWFPPSTH
uniref:Uncharacterized protein n=1 Tax=Timema monikensis TaxID=170555 RepID=A0A7R9HUC6_9NEOP|nr:unnamed protein product [Timema monikensis]